LRAIPSISAASMLPSDPSSDRIVFREKLLLVLAARYQLRAVEIVEGQARSLVVPIVVPTVPDVLLHDAVGVLAGVVADVTIPGPVVPNQSCRQMRGQTCPSGVSPRSMTRRTFDGSLPRVIF
jgi:hypothetical protein